MATSAVHDARRVTTGLGEVWKVSENGYKLYSCCGHTHTAIDAALSLRQEHGWNADQVLEQVREVRVATYGPGWDIVSELNPRTPYQAKFSLAYVVSAALLEGAVGLTQFSEDRFGPSGVIQGTLARLLPGSVPLCPRN
ncbi:hypothetical protein ACFSC4_28575 [Deinococcus malanensis]|uniref:hypothetical protein n=1 Tax=Deinococcus malanensis TaxID=1706855 RepID=UPI00362D7BF8